jgi:hypothetical protein
MQVRKLIFSTAAFHPREVDAAAACLRFKGTFSGNSL